MNLWGGCTYSCSDTLCCVDLVYDLFQLFFASLYFRLIRSTLRLCSLYWYHLVCTCYHSWILSFNDSAWFATEGFTLGSSLLSSSSPLLFKAANVEVLAIRLESISSWSFVFILNDFTTFRPCQDWWPSYVRSRSRSHTPRGLFWRHQDYWTWYQWQPSAGNRWCFALTKTISVVLFTLKVLECNRIFL